MKLEERMFAKTDTEKVIEYASHPDWHLDKAHAMYELAFRALEDNSLLEKVWHCISKEMIFVTRQGPPLGQPAAAVLLGANQDVVEKALVNSMQNWSAVQQADFFVGLVEKAKRRVFLDRLVFNYGFKPKVEIDKNGKVEFA